MQSYYLEEGIIYGKIIKLTNTYGVRCRKENTKIQTQNTLKRTSHIPLPPKKHTVWKIIKKITILGFRYIHLN